MNKETLTEKLYNNYCVRVGGKAFNGNALPTWKDFESHPEKQVQVEAWRGTADDAIYILRVSEEFEKLEANLEKLSKFVDAPKPDHISQDQLNLLEEQYDTMTDLASILQARLAIM